MTHNLFYYLSKKSQFQYLCNFSLNEKKNCFQNTIENVYFIYLFFCYMCFFLEAGLCDYGLLLKTKTFHLFYFLLIFPQKTGIKTRSGGGIREVDHDCDPVYYTGVTDIVQHHFYDNKCDTICFLYLISGPFAQVVKHQTRDL